MSTLLRSFWCVVFHAFSPLLCDFQERDKKCREVMNRRKYWNILGRSMGIGGVGATAEERESKRRSQTLLFAYKTVFSVDAKERVNKIFHNLFELYRKQAAIERRGLTPEWPLYTRAKQLFGPIAARQVE